VNVLLTHTPIKCENTTTRAAIPKCSAIKGTAKLMAKINLLRNVEIVAENRCH